MSQSVLLESALPGLSCRRGKVRDIYEMGDKLLLVSTDRLSAFDWVLPTGIPDKGRVLTQIAAFWFARLDEPNHLITTDVDQMDLPETADRDALRGRTTLGRKTQVVPIECVVRGYLAGSGWAEYQRNGTVCGIPLPAGLVESSQLPEPIFTPATKAETGHDENISFDRMVEIVGRDVSEELRRRSLAIFQRGCEYARDRGIIVADTKFEFGRVGGEIILIDVTARAFAQDLTQTFAMLFREQLAVDIAVEDAYLRAEPDLLKTLMINLADNARKAGATHIAVRGAVIPDGYRFTVSDNGKGIPQCELQNLTRLFYQLEKDRSSARQGVGLGLSLAERIAALHGGTLHFESTVGKGTCVAFDVMGGEANEA